MTRKLIAMLLCVMMAASVITIPAFAAEISYADYVPGEKPANMFKTASEVGGASSWWVNMGTTGESAGKVTRAVTNGYKGTSITAKGTPGGTMEGTAGAWYQINAGVYAGSGILNSNNPSGIAGDIDDGKNYVYEMQVKNLDPTYTPNVRFLLYDLDGPAGLNAVEWGSAGMPVTSTEWMDFKGSIAAPERNKADTVNDVDRISIGFNSSAVAGSSIDMNFTDDGDGMYPLYFAEEAAYDITNELTSASAIVTPKNSASFKAQILNQVGLPGNLSQGTFTWKAMDTDRTTEIPGITVTANGATATVTVDETVAVGEYDIVAYNETYNMAKGYTISVEEPSEYLDYTPAAMPENMLRAPSTVTSAGGFMGQIAQSCGGSGTASMVSRGSASNGKVAITANGTAGEIMSGTGPAYYFTRGLYFGSKIIATNNESGIEADLADNMNYVFKIQVRNLNADITPNVHVLLYDLDGPSANYTKEHGSSGMPITSTDWMDLKGTINNPDRSKTDTANDVDRLSIGFPGATTYAGSSVEFNFTDESDGMYRVYFAEEELYDITNELSEGSSTINCRGEGATLKAQLVNQVGLPGYLTQGTFTWKALDVESRKTEIAGITVTPSEDTTTATVTVDSTVAPGKYVIVAKSDSYDMAKGYEITVEEPNYYEDYVVGAMPANLIDSQTSSVPSMLQYFTQTKESVVKVAWNNWTQIRVTSQVAYDGTTKVGKAGYYMPGAYVHNKILPANAIKNDANYVISYYAKAAEGQDGTTVRDTYTNAGITNYRYESRLHTTKEYGTQGMPVTSDWSQFKGTIYVEPTHPTYASQAASHLAIGLSAEALAGTGVIISDGLNGQPGKVYFAEEAAYDITNELADGSSAALADGASATFEAEVLNQLELPGYLNQDIEWRVMNKARTADINGFVITEGADGTATVKVDGAAPGTYDVVAYSADYKMAKGVEITVLAEEVTSITVDASAEGTFTLSNVAVANSAKANLMIVVASYNVAENKLVDVDKKVVSVSDGSIEFGDALTIDANTGNKVKVFVWDSVSYTPVSLADGVVAEFTK